MSHFKEVETVASIKADEHFVAVVFEHFREHATRAVYVGNQQYLLTPTQFFCVEYIVVAGDDLGVVAALSA